MAYKEGLFIKFKADYDKGLNFEKNVIIMFFVYNENTTSMYKSDNLLLNLDSNSKSFKTDITKFKRIY